MILEPSATPNSPPTRDVHLLGRHPGYCVARKIEIYNKIDLTTHPLKFPTGQLIAIRFLNFTSDYLFRSVKINCSLTTDLMNKPRSLTDEGKAIAQKRHEGANEHKLAAVLALVFEILSTERSETNVLNGIPNVILGFSSSSCVFLPLLRRRCLSHVMFYRQ